jgi:hypothetical protein
VILAGRVVGPPVPPGVLLVVVAAVAACLVTRWVAPAACRAAAWVLRTAVAAVAALLVLPEYRWSARSRRADRAPSPVAYAYGDGVGRVASWVDRLVGFAFDLVARALRALPVALVGVLGALPAIAWSLDLLPLR